MKSHVNTITINTDASFCPNTKASGYAFYIICDNFKLQKGGLFKALIDNSEVAERLCIGNAIHCLYLQKELPTASFIVINTDCIFAYQNIINKKKAQSKHIHILLNKLSFKCSKNGIPTKVEFRHVKAHTLENSARSRANEWCDTEAKKWMNIDRLDKIKKN